MITPGLLRRSFTSAAQWRLALLGPLLLLLPAAIAMIPIARFLGEQLDHAPRWKELVPRLDSSAFFALVKQLGTPGAAGLPSGLLASLLTALLLTPLLAAAALTVARSDEAPVLRELLRGAAEHYGRLLRMQVAAFLPLGLFFAAAAALGNLQSKLAERAVTEASAQRTGRLILAAIALLGFLANLVLDSGRAWFAAQPSRRSAFFALGAGVKLVVRRPLQALTIGLVTALATLLFPAMVLVLRQRVTQGSGGTVAFAFLLAQIAVALVAYGHAARLIGLTELARADLADCARNAAFEMAPPRTSPPPPGPLSPLAAISPVSEVPAPAPAPEERGPSFSEPPATPAPPAQASAAIAQPAPADGSPQIEQEAALGPVGVSPDFGAGPGGGTGGGA